MKICSVAAGPWSVLRKDEAHRSRPVVLSPVSIRKVSMLVQGNRGANWPKDALLPKLRGLLLDAPPADSDSNGFQPNHLLRLSGLVGRLLAALVSSRLGGFVRGV